MYMKAKSSVVRKLRSEKLWSQETLAQACGLSLRTIQRLEARGSGSQESIKALASVFEVSPESLVWPDSEFETYRHRQWGIVSIGVFLMAGAGVLILNDFAFPLGAPLLGVVFGILTLTALVFSSMTIEVNESDVTWFFGPGVLKKSLPLEEVGSCKKVKNPIWMGFGIHAFGTGWIYNVSGLLGVEIELKGGAFVRLGSDQPNYLCQAIMDAKNNLE